MPDLLVPLYRLPPRGGGAASVRAAGVVLRRANTFELTPVTEFIRGHFSQGWADEAAATFARQPITCVLAIEDKQIRGFAAFESTRKAFFGPTGVDPAHRGRGLGRALLIEALWGLHDLGYAYGIIGAAGPVEFYQKAVGATVIPDSWPGVYADLLR
jgi:GNAT superfamily N-acetyltransferase